MTFTTTATGRPQTADAMRIGLTDHEQDQLVGLATSLAVTEPGLVDDPGWQKRSRTASSLLPARLTSILREFRHDSGPAGTLTVTNLPLGPEPLPPTPVIPDSTEPTASIPATLATLLGNHLGTLTAYRDEKHGALVQNVVPVPTLATTQSNGGSVDLELHTENAFHPHRPDFLALLCLRPAHTGPVGTRVASIRHVIPLLDPTIRRTLSASRFITEAPPSFHSNQRSEAHAVLTGAHEDPDICVDFHATRGIDHQACEALTHLRRSLMSIHVEVELRAGDMVFLDNRIVVHGRVAFTPRYDGTDRWLHRIFIHLDHRRTRPQRPHNGLVLV